MAKKVFSKKVRRTFPKKRKARKAKTSLLKTVRRMIARTEEIKTVTVSSAIDAHVITSTTAGVTQNYIPICPNTGGILSPDQGTNEGQMVGNKIRTKRMVLRGTITANAYNATSNQQIQPVFVKAWVIYNKQYPQLEPQAADWAGAGGNVFDEGIDTNGCLGWLTDMTKEVNRRQFVCKAIRTWKIGPAVPPQVNGNTTPMYNYSNNDFKMSAMFKWDLTKHLDKVYTYNNVGDTWDNPRLCVMFQIVAADGTTLNTSQTPVRITYYGRYDYTDA